MLNPVRALLAHLALRPFLFLAGLSGLLRSLHLAFAASPAGHDITLVASMARLYVRAWQNGELFPATWLPLYGAAPLQSFHSLLAPLLGAGLQLWPESLPFLCQLTSVLGFWLYDLAVLWLTFLYFSKLSHHTVRPFAGRGLGLLLRLGLVLAFVSYLPPVPGRFLGSGGGVFVFAAALALLGLSAAIKSGPGEASFCWPWVGLALLLFALSLAVHPMPACHVLLLAPFFLCGFWLRDFFESQQPSSSGRVPWSWLAFLGRSALLLALITAALLPQLLSLVPAGGAYTEAVYRWIDVVLEAYALPRAHPWLLGWPQAASWLRLGVFLLKQAGLSAVFLTSFFYLARVKSRESLYFSCCFLGTCLLAWFGHKLPRLGLAFYPDRLLPYAFIFAGLAVVPLSQQLALKKSWAQSVLFMLVLAASLGRFAWNYLNQARELAYLRPEDRAVIHAIPQFVPEATLIATDYADAGVWIPALVARPVTEPHIHLAFEEEWLSYKAQLEQAGQIRWSFVGSSCARRPECWQRLCPAGAFRVLLQKGQSRLCQKG